MADKKQFTFQRTIPVSFSGKFPPDTRALSGLGFDSVSSTGQAITIMKCQLGISAIPLSRLEITLKRNSAMLKIAAPASCDPQLQELHTVSTFLHVISLLPSCQASASELAHLIIPSLDAAASIADAPYESLSRKCRDAHDSLSSLLAKNHALLRSSEEGVLASLELERQSSVLSARIKKLESVSDDTLLELVQEWLSSHHGIFNAALFAKAHNLPPARAEEGIERLLSSGTIRKVGGSLHVQREHIHGTFENRQKGALATLSQAIKLPALVKK